MVDIIDKATDEIMAELSDKIIQHRLKVQALKKTNQFCESCGEPIPLARQRAVANCQYCIECQTEKEKTNYAK